ncbi:MAG: MBL fold metallo-hydrolase [Balneolaceae bacterium]
MKSINLYFTLFILSIFNSSLFAQIDSKKSELKIEKLDEHIYLAVQNTNISNPTSIIYIKPDFSLLIDPGFTQMQSIIRDSIEALNGGPIKYVMGTHFHTDHAQALEEYYDTSNILLSSYQYPGAKDLKLSRVFSSSGSSYNLNLGEEELEIHTLPEPRGHTSSDAVFYFKSSNIIVVGDYLFYDMYPIIDVNGGGSIDGYFKNLNYILGMIDNDSKVIPGHTSFKPEVEKNYYSKEELTNHVSELLESIEWVKVKKKNGATLSLIIEEGLPSKYGKYNEGMKFVSEEKWITFIYKNSLSKTTTN